MNSPTLERLREVLVSRQLQVVDHDGVLLVNGASAAIIGDIAAANGITIHELTTLRESLEEAFLRITSGRAEYQSGPTDGARIMNKLIRAESIKFRTSRSNWLLLAAGLVLSLAIVVMIVAVFGNSVGDSEPHMLAARSGQPDRLRARSWP